MYYEMEIAGLKRQLPLCPVNDSLYIAGFVMFDDVEITVKTAEELLKKGEEAINQAHEVHTKLLFAEAQNPGSVQPTIMFVHASNHLAIAEWSLEDCRMKVEIYRLLKTK